MEYADYIDENEYVTLYRMYGSGSIAEIPDRIAGKPVRALADHLFANEPSVFWKPVQIRRAVLRGTSYIPQDEAFTPEENKTAIQDLLSPEEEPAALCGAALEIIRIPEGVERIGNYAFYGCSSLREISFPSTMKWIGNGMFNGCGQICRLNFELGSAVHEMISDSAGMTAAGRGAVQAHDPRYQNPSVMKEVLDAVSDQIEAVVTLQGKEQWRLTFPEYYEEGKENTPARIIEIVYHGTGYLYRNCFLNRKIQFDRYDEVFPLAAAREKAETCIPVIRNRLRCGPPPREEWTYRYIDYLRSEKNLLIERILADREFDPVSELRVLDRAGFFTTEIVDAYIRYASDRKRSDVVSYLMDVKRRITVPAGKGRYEL